MDYRNNVFTFNTNIEAVKFVDYVEQILKEYGRITLADLYDYAYREDSDYLENKVVWLEETLTSPENRIYPRYDEFKHWWYVKFPEPDQYPAQPVEKKYKDFYYKYRRTTTPHSITYTKETPTPEPLNITIIMDADPLKDPYTTIKEVLTEANKIKDRPIFITIN